MNTYCPNCGKDVIFSDGHTYICPDCSSEWNDHYDMSDDAEQDIED